MKRKTLIFSVVGLIHASFVGYATERVPHPKVEEIADTWIGFNEDDLYYYRLNLNTNGNGICASTFVRDPAKLYRVTEWTLDNYAIEIKLEPVDPKAEPIWMKGETAGLHLDLMSGGKELKWKRKIKLYRESDVIKAHERVKTRMRMTEKAEQSSRGDSSTCANAGLEPPQK